MSSSNNDFSKNISSEKTNKSSKISKHNIEKDSGQPDFTPNKEKIKGPSHATSSSDMVEKGIDSSEFGKNPFS